MSGTAKTLVDRIYPHAPGWSRTGTRSILKLIQEAQDDLLDCYEPRRVFVSTDNEGWPPYLKTTAGTYRYNINEDNLTCSLSMNIGGTDRTVRCKEVLRIIVDTSEDYDYNRKYIGEEYVYGFINPYSSSNSRQRFAKIKVRSYPALEETQAYVDFPEDPGTTTDRYFCEFTWEAPRLTSENIPLVVPTEFYRGIEEYVIGRIQQMENGKENEFLRSWDMDSLERVSWKSRFKTLMRSGAAMTDELTPRIYC